MKYEQVWEAVDKLAKIKAFPLPDWPKKPDLIQQPLTKANARVRMAKKDGHRLTA